MRWVKALLFFSLAINKQSHLALLHCMSPYEAFFGQKSRWESKVPMGYCELSTVGEVDIINDKTGIAAS